MPLTDAEISRLTQPPAYCDYANGPCDQDFDRLRVGQYFFIYPSTPETISATIETAAQALRRKAPESRWHTWRDLPIAGQVIFCEICKALRSAPTAIADVTTLNFNLLFEIGFAIGLGIPVIPIRDTTYELDKAEFDELGLLDTLGYIDFANSDELSKQLLDVLPAEPLGEISPNVFRSAPLYVVKTPINTEGQTRLMSTIKKSAIRFRVFDPIETHRISLNEARRQVYGSVALVAQLLSPQRTGSRVHNSRAALMAGIATARGKVVSLIQEEHVRQPIDYRDLVLTYSHPDQIPHLLESPIRRIVDRMQADVAVGVTSSDKNLLHALDLGDVAAENEIGGLGRYFVPTGPFEQARKGHARLVVGRKGTGKTAMFYEIRNSMLGTHTRTVLDLRPEAHQFTRLREYVLSRMSPGVQEHMLTSFWLYVLYTEIARHAVQNDRSWAYLDPSRAAAFDAMAELYREHDPSQDADLSERLFANVGRLVAATEGSDDDLNSDITQQMFVRYLPGLREVISTYLREKDEIWLLVDNLDKGWPIRGAEGVDILIVRSLLEAARKLQNQLEDLEVGFHCLIFLRTDIYEFLQLQTPDKGKDTEIRLDWDDTAVFEEIVRRRVETSTGLRGTLREIWPSICVSHIGAEDSFNYIVDRTLMRPRDLLAFIQRAIEVSINRGHNRIEVEDLKWAERTFSEDLLLATSYEIQDTKPELAELVYTFQGLPGELPHEDVELLITESGIAEGDVEEAIRILVWFCFLGVVDPKTHEGRYAYEVRWNLKRLLSPLESGEASLAVHPAFRAALNIS